MHERSIGDRRSAPTTRCLGVEFIWNSILLFDVAIPRDATLEAIRNGPRRRLPSTAEKLGNGDSSLLVVEDVADHFHIRNSFLMGKSYTLTRPGSPCTNETVNVRKCYFVLL